MQIVIPIGTGSNWENNELRYCLRSLQKNLKFDLEPIILGEQGVDITWLRNVLYVAVERFYPDNLEEEYGAKFFENYYAVLHKLCWFCNQDICGDEFLYVYDDQIFLNPVFDSLEFFNKALHIDKSNKLDKKKRTRHERTILQALELAHGEKHYNGLANHETHAPRLYNKVLLQKLFHRFPLEATKIPYALATLYYNLFFDDPVLVDKESCRHVCYLHFDDGRHHYCPVSELELDNSIKDYTVCSYNDKGLDVRAGVLKSWLAKRYPTKSIYEE